MTGRGWIGSEQATAPGEPPHSVKAEEWLLGGLLVNDRTWADAVDSVSPEDFHHPPHGLIFRVVSEMAVAGQPVDLVTLSEELSRRSLLEAVGGADYLIAGRPGMGKSTLMTNIAEHAAQADAEVPNAVFFFSLDDPAEVVASRLLSSLGPIDLNFIRRGLPWPDWERLADVLGRLGKIPLYLEDGPQTAKGIRLRARQVASLTLGGTTTRAGKNYVPNELLDLAHQPVNGSLLQEPFHHVGHQSEGRSLVQLDVWRRIAPTEPPVAGSPRFGKIGQPWRPALEQSDVVRRTATPFPLSPSLLDRCQSKEDPAGRLAFDPQQNLPGARSEAGALRTDSKRPPVVPLLPRAAVRRSDNLLGHRLEPVRPALLALVQRQLPT